MISLLDFVFGDMDSQSINLVNLCPIPIRFAFPCWVHIIINTVFLHSVSGNQYATNIVLQITAIRFVL